MRLATWAFASLVPAGVVMMLALDTPAVVPAAPELARLGAALLVGGCGYCALVGATRTGEVSVVVPFRYTRLVFAMVGGALVFGERPGPLMLAGAALIVGAGLCAVDSRNAASLAGGARSTRGPRRQASPAPAGDAVECETSSDVRMGPSASSRAR
ncbi:MAG: DMT family transporter [Halofilum sp. (in: g-proteobacteria)]|nr:DMT family transporter [Halofilum sp. (in: g-proteobacteria)]